MRYIPIFEQFLRERVKNIKLREQTERNAANTDYIAMMCDIELKSDDESTEEASEIE